MRKINSFRIIYNKLDHMQTAPLREYIPCKGFVEKVQLQINKNRK